MAEGTSGFQDNVVCRYFLTSSCRDGDSCLFSHDPTRRIPDSMCRYYLQGICIFGPNCRYDHVLLNKERSSNKPPPLNVRNCPGTSYLSDNRDVPCNVTRSETNKRSSQPKLTALSPYPPRNYTNIDRPTSSNWVNAPEFVPKHTPRSYADTVKVNTFDSNAAHSAYDKSSEELCPFLLMGGCPSDTDCRYLHGNVCELCHKACLHPYNEEQRKSHTEQCEKELEQDMEFSFAIQHSMEKTCGICMDVVLKKEPESERRFGILEKCNHVYCLSCIRKWRSSRQRENNQQSIDSGPDPIVTRACPECRMTSDFIIPSAYFVDTEEEKQKLITEYKIALSKKPCKYFKQGEGSCPFGGACFYLHAKPDGTKVELPLPTRRRRLNQNGELDFMGRNLLWDFLEYQEENALISVDIATLMFSWSDSDDDSSELSDSFFLSEAF